MDCNKEDALRDKELAEKKFEEGDIAEAKRFALKAQNLNPKIDGLSQLIATLDVYISAEKSTNGEIDWYRVLGVEPLADELTIRNQFMKLSYVIRPDRNNSVGALGAYKILSEAWSTLSDKARRIAYDHKRSLKCKFENVFDRKSSAPAGENDFPNISSSNVPNGRGLEGTNSPQPSLGSSTPTTPTFWTACHGCKTQFEYLRCYLRRNLLCPNCHQPFRAIEVPPPPKDGGGILKPWASHMRTHNSGESTLKNSSSAQETTPASNTSTEQARFSGLHSPQKTSLLSEVKEKERRKKEASAESVRMPTVNNWWDWKRKFSEGALGGPEVAKTSSPVLKKEVVGATPGSSGAVLGTLPKGDMSQKKKKTTNQKMATSVATGNAGIALKPLLYSQEGGTATTKWDLSTTRWNMAGIGNNRPHVVKELTQKEVRNMLIKKAQKVIHGKLVEWRTAAVQKIRMKENEKGKKEAAKPAGQADMRKYSKHVDTKKKESTGKMASRKINLNLTPEIPHPVSMTVADPDFYDFDKNRTKKSFGNNQVWAAYDQEDGMPRYYAMIHRVMSVKPLRMKISWLNSKSNDEFGPLRWIASGFPKTSGDFRAGKQEVYGSLNSFSHQVKWTRGTRGVVQIYPRKGEVWAVYRNWSPDWNERTPDDVIQEYDMVEVLEDYNEFLGLSVYPLVKVVGFKTVFCRHRNPITVMKIPREEMFRLSHQVPSHLLTGTEGRDAPQDCLELDPAATPSELLQVKKKARREEMVKTADKLKEEDSIESLKISKVAELVENRNQSIEKDPAQDAEEVVTEKKGKENEGKLAVFNRRRSGKVKNN